MWVFIRVCSENTHCVQTFAIELKFVVIIRRLHQIHVKQLRRVEPRHSEHNVCLMFNG